MRTDLDHLPDAKRRELVRVVQILFEEFEAATETKSHAHRRNGQSLKIILYGSRARGDWATSMSEQSAGLSRLCLVAAAAATAARAGSGWASKPFR